MDTCDWDHSDVGTKVATLPPRAATRNGRRHRSGSHHAVRSRYALGRVPSLAYKPRYRTCRSPLEIHGRPLRRQAVVSSAVASSVWLDRNSLRARYDCPPYSAFRKNYVVDQINQRKSWSSTGPSLNSANLASFSDTVMQTRARESLEMLFTRISNHVDS